MLPSTLGMIKYITLHYMYPPRFMLRVPERAECLMRKTTNTRTTNLYSTLVNVDEVIDTNYETRMINKFPSHYTRTI